MNLNIISYIIYGVFTIYIIYVVGKLFHQNGRVFIVRLFNGNESSADTTNNLLLLAYYLFNIGYTAIQLNFWQKVTTVSQLISSVSAKAGVLIMILAITHYLNLCLIYFLSKKYISNSIINKN